LSLHNLHGVALVNKPAGMTSFSVVSRLRRAFRPLGVTKAGHTGTLDPLATGLLPICIGEATKFAQRLLDADKGYLATVKLGASTTTADAEGEIVARAPVNVNADKIEAALAQFRGRISQIPPIYSALKINGKPAYEYARAGKSVEMAARDIEIFELKLIDVRDDEFDIDVRCSKGTYIRTLAVDVAIALETVGHLTRLHRTMTGGFNVKDAHPLEDWMTTTDETRTAWLLPADVLVNDFPRVDIDAHQSQDIRNGKQIHVVSAKTLLMAAPAKTLLRLYDPTRGFLGIGATQGDGVIRVERLFSTNTA
jgi:tRNA pseudouridine55 synthase